MNEIVPCFKIKEEYDDQTKVGLSAALASLSVEEETLVLLRYKYGESFSALGRTYNLTHEAVRQKIKKAIRKLMQPPYRSLMEYGIDGYINVQATEQAKEKVQNFLRNEYLRGYSDGVMAQIKNENAIKQREKEQELIGQMKDSTVLGMTIEELELSVRSFNCLSRAGIKTVYDILQLDEEGISKIRNLGLICIDEIGKKLAQYGIRDTKWDIAKIREFRDQTNRI